MAFIPSFSVALDALATNITITDTSGTYDGVTNLIGWGSLDRCAPADGLGPVDLNDVIDITITIVETVTFTTVATVVVPRVDLPLVYSGDFIISTFGFGLGAGTFNVTSTYNMGTCTLAPVVSTTVILAPFPEEAVEGCISSCITNACNLLEMEECTSTTTSTCNPNPVGWYFDPVTNVDTRRVYVEIWDYLNNTLIDTIVLLDKDILPVINLFPSPHDNKFDLPDYTFSFGDGIYEFKYFIETRRPFQPNYIVQIGSTIESFLCNAKNCVCALWEKALEECDKKERAKRIDIAQDAELMLFGIASKQGCLDLSKAEEIKEILIKICELDNCDSNTDCNC